MSVDVEALKHLLDRTKTHKMTYEERREQRISFGYGNVQNAQPERDAGDGRRSGRARWNGRIAMAKQLECVTKAKHNARRYAELADLLLEAQIRGEKLYGWVGKRFFEAWPGGRSVDRTS